MRLKTSMIVIAKDGAHKIEGVVSWTILKIVYFQLFITQPRRQNIITAAQYTPPYSILRYSYILYFIVIQ